MFVVWWQPLVAAVGITAAKEDVRTCCIKSVKSV